MSRCFGISCSRSAQSAGQRLLFCETTEVRFARHFISGGAVCRLTRAFVLSSGQGKIAFVRQLVPTLYVDDDAKVLSAIRPHIEVLVNTNCCFLFLSLHARAC